MKRKPFAHPNYRWLAQSTAAEQIPRLVIRRLWAKNSVMHMDRSELGKLLLDKRGGGGFYAGGAICIAVGVILLASFAVADTLGLKISSLVLGPAMLAWGIIIFRLGGKRLYVYEGGIADNNIVIPFEQISSYSFVLQEIAVSGVHAQTNAIFWFVPRFPAGRRQFRFAFQEKRKIDPAIEVTHDYITSSLAESMLNELRAGKSVTWTKSLTFRPEGLEYRQRDGANKIARYRDLTEPVVESSLGTNKVRLTAQDSDAYLATLTPDEFNFYPGMLVIEKMRAAETAGS
jgi:hypothetical protein